MIEVTKRRTYVTGILGSLLLGTVLLWILPVPTVQSPGILAFIGRLHPILVHFPIVLVPLLTGGYLFVRWKKLSTLTPLVQIGWLITVAITIAALATGYFLYASGEYGGMLVQRHLQGGVVVAILLISGALMIFQQVDPIIPSRLANGTVAALIGVNVALIYTGHQGGSLTHGEGFLFDALPRPTEAVLLNKPQHEYNVYQDLVVPVLEAKCMSCHNENKSKGDLILTSYSNMETGGKSGKPAVVAGIPGESALYDRVTLPPGDDDFMPPEGKSPLLPVEIALLKWWIAEGARTDMVYEEGPADSLLSLQIENYLPSLLGARVRQLRSRNEFRALAASFTDAVTPLGLFVEVDTDSDSSFFAVSVQFPTDVRIDDNTVAALRPYAPYVSSLSLVGTEITDDALFHIASMPNLQELYLANTAIDGSGIAYLKDLKQLNVLNLSNTELIDAHAFDVAALPALSTLYVFNTKMEATVEAALKAHRPDVDVLHEEGPFNKR